MPPSSTPDQPTNSTPPEWFAPAPSGETSLPPNSSDPKRRLIVIGVLTGTVLVLCMIAASILTYRALTACLTPADYQQLTGHPIEDSESFSPKDNFYMLTLIYDNKAATPRSEQSDSSIDRLAAFYKKHASTRPITITLSGGFTENDERSATQKRLDTLQAQLIERGVKESAIVSEAPYEIISGQELSSDSEELKSARVYVSLNSSGNCTE